MRLISQDGMIDVPYDKCCLEVVVSRREGSVVYFIYAHTNKMTLSLARYSSESKALKVMEMLRDAYVGLPILFQNVDMNESVVEKLKEWKRDGIVLLHDNADSKIEQVNNAIFKFPADEEVEV